MQEIIIQSRLSNVIDINDCDFNVDRIYAYRYGTLRVLVRYKDTYYWSDFQLASYNGFGSSTGFNTPQEAIKCAIDNNQRIYVFKNQCEFKEWAMEI